MSFSGMWIAAAQTAAFSALTKIFEHESDRWELKDVWENEAFANFTRVVLKQTAIANSTTPADASSVLSIGDGTTTTTTTTNASFPHLNGSAANNSTGYPPTMGTESDSSFYLGTLQCVIFVSLVTCALFYWWQVWLERMLPGRPRRVEVAYHQQQHQKHGGGSGGEKKKMVVVEGDEDREEEVVKRWIAEGKVQRSSLSWGNTFLKWILDITVGRAALRAFWASLELVVKWKRPLSDIWGFWTWVCSFYQLPPFSRVYAWHAKKEKKERKKEKEDKRGLSLLADTY